jgi:hypothetical protein
VEQSGETPVVIDAARACRLCGYDLRGLDSGAACPECGADERGVLSIDATERAWARWAGAGAVLAGAASMLLPIAVLIAFIGLIVGVLISETIADAAWFRWPWLVLGLVACEQALGWWFVTSVRGSRERGRERRRLGVRALGLGACALLLANVGVTLAGTEAMAPVLPRGLGAVLLGKAALIATVCLASAHLLALGEAAHLARRAGDDALAERLLGLRRMPFKVLMFWGGAILCTPIVMLMDLILGLAGLVYFVSINLLMPALLIGSVVLSGASMIELGRRLGRIGSAPSLKPSAVRRRADAAT